MEISEGLGSHVLDNLTPNIAVLDGEGTILGTNEAWKSFAEENELQPPVDSVGVNYLEVYADSESRYADRAVEGIRAVLEGERERFALEYPCHSPDSERWFQLRVKRTTYEGEPYAIVSHWNITERKLNERRVEESNERLQQFAYAVSHDLQEPLRMITSYLGLIERRYEDELDEDGREFIEFAVDGAERMRDMIEGLLEYSRVETRGDPFAPVDLEAVLEEVSADLQVAIDDEGGELTVESLPTIEGDRSQLRRLFQNLLENAIKYSGEEPPRIHVEAEESDGEWIVAVSDNGIGIDPDDQDRIFDVFDRLHSREEYEGTGIGLALCRRIAERHGGTVEVESEPGEGSTFFVTLSDA
ncbi:PAS domain-containing sensor histidine kinase [Natronococcus jeotgali]|uniref:histidine kinase n=1 Tax=Natronococcus jeotgali DSM 18795 TaxID=1227498 RepID=L9WN78_9EURY|nr:ATP-binding protein [Natronococcus jeotgali]ELY50847.1 PAS/PAC sensor signal transduction histidine kinase [Natronococcus jeotgali DSM 18795]